MTKLVCLQCDQMMVPVDPTDAHVKAIRVTHQCPACKVYTDGTYSKCGNRCCRKKNTRGHLQLVRPQGGFAGLNGIYSNPRQSG